MDNEVKKLYSALIGKGYTTRDLGDEQTFMGKMQDADNRKQLYDWVNARGDFRIGSYDDYEKRLTAPPAPKAEDINPTDYVEKSGNTFADKIPMVEKLPQIYWTEESIASPKLPEIERKDIFRESPYKANYEKVKAAGDKRSYEEWLKSLPKAYDNDDVVGENGELLALVPKEKIRSDEYGGLSREQAEFLRAAGHNNDIDAVKALNRKDVRDQVNESYKEITDAWSTTRGIVNDEYYGSRWYDRPLQVFNKITSGTDATDFTTDKDVHAMRAADKLIGEAKSVMDAATEGKSFFAGAGEVLSQWNPVKSLEGLIDADAVESVVKKIEEGKELSYAENALLESFALNAAAHTYYEDEVSNLYNAGKVVGDMIPLAAEMLANPASGMARKWAQATLKRVAGKSMSKATKKALMYAAGTTGAFAGGTTMAATTGLPSVLEEAQRNSTGRALFDFTDGGDIYYAGVEGGGAFGDEVIKSLYRRGVENATEQMGAEWLTRGLGKVAGKVVAAIPGGEKAVKYATDLMDNKYAHYLGELAEKANYQGPIEEFVEEIESAVLGVPVDGMESLKEFFDGDNLITTAIAVSVPGFGMGAINAIGGVATGQYKVGYKENQKRMQAYGRGMEAFADNQSEWNRIVLNINSSSVSDVETELKRVYHSPDYTDEQKQRVLEYAVHSLKYRTLVEAKTAMADDTTKMLNDMLGGRYSEGYEVADEQKGAVKQAYDMERERVLNTFGEEVVQRLDDDPIGALMELNEIDRQEAIAYVNARTAYEGMIDRISDDIDERVKASDKEIDSHKNRQDGAIHPAMMRGVNGAAPKRVYIVNGNVATFEDGTIDKANSSSMIIVRDAETGEVAAASADDLESLDAVIDTEAEKKTVAEQIANEYAGQQAAIIEGENGVQPEVAPVVEDQNGDNTGTIVESSLTGEAAAPVIDKKARRTELEKMIPVKGKKKQFTEVEPAVTAEYISLLTDDVAKQVAAADKYIAMIREAQEKADPVEALEMDEQIAYWNEVKSLLAPQESEIAAPVVEAPQATNEMQEADLTEDVKTEDVNQSENNLEMVAEGENAPGQSGVEENEEVGPFGRIYRQFKGKAKEAIQFLLGKKEGEAVGALSHPEIGDISLVWGNSKAGLEKIASKHPEVLDDLQEVINDMKVVSTSENRIKLESDTHFAVVSREYLGKPRDQWLLTAYEKKNSAFGNTMDTGETSDGGKQNDTATLQNTVSTNEGTTQSANEQENSVKSEETAQKRRKPSKKSGGAEPKQVDVESLMGALKQKGEAKLSDHVVNPSGNKLVTDERYNELKERMKKKLNGQMNIGVDPEILAIGTEMAVYHIEKGARKFADFAKGMIADLGDAIRPYLKAFYNGARELPEIEEAGFTKDMTPYEEVKTFDVANFDKQAVDAMATAETVTREAEVAKDVEAVKAPKKRESSEGKKLRKATPEDLEGNPVVYYKGEKHHILMLVRRGEQTSGARFTKPEITRVYLENMQDVKVEDLYVEDTRENVGESGNNSVPSQQTPVNNLNENNDGREEITAADNSGAQPGREELPDTEQVGARVPVQDTARNSKRKRRNAGVGSSELGNGPQYDVNRNYTNEEIETIVSSVTDIVDGKVVITGEVTDDIKAIVRGYESGGIAKKGRGILDEYYTDGKIVDAVNLLIAPYFSGSTPIRVLEPSVGIGNFIQAVNNIPTSEVVAFEINETTARIAKILYPDVDVNLRSFETEFIDESGNKKPMPQKYSLVIGNPPYGSHRGLYKGLGEESKIARYEDYFVKRSLDVLDEGGVLAMVLPSSWMDRHTKFGGYTIERAYRLPSGAFEATQVGTDIVILKKDSSVPVTEHAPYFEQFPERVLGEVKQRKGRYGRLEEYVEGDIDAAIEAIKKENAEQVADLLDIEKNNDALNDIESAVDETGSPEKAVAIVKDAQESEKAASKREQSTSSLDAMPSERGLRNAKADKKPAKKPSGKQGKYKVELNRGVETVPTSAQFTHEFSEGEVEAFADTDYEGALSNPTKHRRYANYIGGQAIHDFYYAEGDIYSKLAQLEQEKDYIVENYGVEQYEKQKALLESVLPKQKSLEEITISPNTTFVKNLNILTEGGRVSLKDMFVDFLRKLPRQAFGNSSSWEVVGYINNEQVHGTDKQRNQLIRERRKRVANDLFNKFLSEELSDNAKKQVVAAFNREYNSTYRPDYSKVPMFSDINRDFKGKPLKLTSVQLAGIGRMTVKGVGVLAHEVGFGKTLSGILAMHEAMTRGFAEKPLIVVPNDNILKQWVETIGEVLPNATVNTLGNLGAGYDLTDFKVNDGEFTIITYEGLKAMSFSDYTYEHLASKFSYITEDLNKHQSERDIQKEIEKKNELKGKMKRGTKSSYMFEDFGFDWLTVDEVHNANHIVSKVRLDKSVASDFRSQSQRTSDLGLKTWLAAQYIQEENNGRNVLLLSATPFTNKPLEYYSILSLVGNDMLERKGFFNVDQFFATFMEADNELEIGANGRPTQKTNVRRFRNNGLFQQLLSEFIDIKGEEDNPELVRPERLNKEYKIAQNELTAEAMAAAQELLSDNDTVLQGIGHARAAAFSPYATALLGRQPKNHKEFVKNSPKIDATIRMIEQNIKDRPDAGQIIYSEVGVEYFPLIRDYLVKESGLKPSEVRIITGATSNNERVNIQTAFNNGEVKVVIGSPAIKEGLNLQGNTTDMYILSLPWNFTQLRQIEGRGWRQGNRWENIRINYMLTNDSVDVFMLQRLQLKQGLYNEAMKSGAESLDVSDIDTAELKTALITDPAVRAEIVTVQERAKFQQEKTQIEADLSFVMRKYEAYNKLVEKLENAKRTIKMYREWAQRGDEYWAQRAEREEALLPSLENEIEEEKQNLLKKGVNVDDIVRQTEQAQNAIAAIQEKIDNLKEFQEELTQKFREESETKAKEQGDLVSTYIKERKAENKGGFYRIRPEKTETKATEEETEDGVLYRSSEDNEARAITYDEAVQIVNDFTKTFKGAAKRVVISKGKDALEQQMREAGFVEESIEAAMEVYASDDIPTAGHLWKSDGIVVFRFDSAEKLYEALWHENIHRALRKIYGNNRTLAQTRFDELPDHKKQEYIDFFKANGYKKSEYAEEALCYFVGSLPRRYGYLKNGRYDITTFFIAGNNAFKRFVNFAQSLIDYIVYHGEETEHRGLYDRTDGVVESGNEGGNGVHQRNSEIERDRTATTGGLTEEEIAMLEAATGYTREEIIEIFGDDLNRQGNGPLTDREVVMESDVYSKVLGKPRYYGKRQREFVARQRRRMAEKARQVAEKLNLDNVEVLESTEGLTGKKATSKGWFDPRTGKITVVVPNHGSTGDIVETVLHEAVAHYGLRKLFGENFKNFLDNVYNNVTPEIRAEITELAKKHGWDFHTATEEYLASLAENTNFEKVNPSLWSNIKSFFMKMLAKVGITLDEPLGDNELRYILWRSHQNLVNPGWFNVFGQAEDIAKQYELGVGNYASGEVKTENGGVAAEDDSALLHREGGAPGSAREEYERKVRRPNKSGSVGATENVARRAQEAYQDSMLALKILQDAVARETGNEVKDNENAYIAENRMSSSNKAMVEIYERDFFMPLMDEINALIKEGVEYDDIIRYLHAKHGLERNEYMRRKQAEEAALRDMGEEPAMPNEGDADYEAKVNAKAAWRANLAELTESYVKKFAKRDYSGLTALTETANAKDAEAAAQQMVDEFENDHDTTPLWEAVNKATKETLRREFVGGLIDRATYDTVSTMFDFYIPLRGWDENVAANEYEYFTNNNTPVFTPAIKTMHGRKSLSDDPIATTGYMAGSAIARANRNLMKQKFLNFVMNNPTSLATVSEQWYTMDYGTNEWVPNNPAIPEDATPEQVVEIMEAHEANMRALEKAGKATRERSGLKIGLHATKQEQQQHVVRVLRNGKEYAVYINGNPRAAQALNGMTNPDVSKSKAREAAQNVKNFMARAFTSRNPAFIISNSARDVIWAGTAVAAKEDAEYTMQYTKNVTAVLAKFKLPRLLRKFQKGTLDKNNEIERYFDEFLRNGGETGFTQVLTVEDYKRNIERFTKEAKNGTRISKKAWRGLWNGIEFLNRSAEDITRFTVYMTSRQMGRSIERSVYDAKEITVNFNKKGSGEMGARYLNFAYIFFNATIQSLANFGKLVYRHPGKMAAALGTFGMMGFLMPVINAALMALGDDDDEENYWNLPEWVRRNNIVLFVPWTEKGFITIPLPHELRPFYGMGENAMSALLGKQTIEDAIKKSLVGFTGMLPIDFTANGGDVVVNVMPTILQPFAQVRANVTHFGTPIYKDNDFNKRYPSWTKAYKGTNSTLVAATKWLNELGGGNNVDSGGLLDWNPAVIEHLFESYLGGMGKTFNKAATTVSMLWDEEARIARNIPVASSFYQESDERTAGSQLNREYFDALEEMEGFQHRLSGYQKEITKGNAEYEKLFEDLVNPDEFMRYGIIKDYSNAIRELDQVLKNNNPAEEEAQEIEGVIQELKKEMLDELEKLQAEE